MALGVLLAVIPSLLLGQGKGMADRVPREIAATRVTGSPQYAVLNCNNLTTWVRSNGISNHSPSADDGMYYPLGTGSVIYQDGLVWAGKAYANAGLTVPAPRQLVRAGGSQYVTGTRAGSVTGSGATAVAEDSSSTNVRVYRIRRDYASMPDYKLWRDAATVYEISENSISYNHRNAVVDQYALDWAAWPVAKGAPFIDRNGNGVYDPPPPFSWNFTVDSLIAGGYDEPGVAGLDKGRPADQVIWMVYNDLNVSTAQSFAGSEPLGLEVQKTVWGYDRNDALGNVFFTRFRIINKGGVDVDTAAGTQLGSFWIDSLYIGQWSDPDLGDFRDDLVGSDVSTSLGYVYNGAQNDAEFSGFSLPPPSIGYDILSGPTVASPGDSAFVNFGRRTGVRALPMTSFGVWAAGEVAPDPGWDPYLEPTGQLWKVLRGYRPWGSLLTPDQPFNTGPYPESRYQFPDDPLRGPGQVDGLGTSWSQLPGDRRMLLASGPATLAPGDTQEVYIATVAGLGADRLSSLSVMRWHDRTTQTYFDRGLVLPVPPAPPVVTASELDGAIVLNWGSNLEAVRATEEPILADDYAFEGYVVYQLPEINAAVSRGVRIATFDVRNGRTRIMSDIYDAALNFVISTEVQRGSDSGVQRSLTITRSYEMEADQYGEHAWTTLRNGAEYYFAVTAYNVAMDATASPTSLESSPVSVSVKPRIPFGRQLPTKVGDTLAVSHLSGLSVAAVVPIVVDPLAGRGDTFRIIFGHIAAETRWSLLNRSGGTTLMSDEPFRTDAGAYPIVDGVLVTIRSEQSPDSTDVYEFVIPAPVSSREIERSSADRIGVFPNPYYAEPTTVGSGYSASTRQIVTFNNLPPRATIRIFNLAGHLVRTLRKEAPTQFLEWDLQNENGWRVASGMYLCHVELPDLGLSKVLKLAVVAAVEGLR